MPKLKDMFDALKIARDALEQVIKNQEYQLRTGGKYFTSAPTEYEWKHAMQEKTDAAVISALEQIDDVLYGKISEHVTLENPQ